MIGMRFESLFNLAKRGFRHLLPKERVYTCFFCISNKSNVHQLKKVDVDVDTVSDFIM